MEGQKQAVEARHAINAPFLNDAVTNIIAKHKDEAEELVRNSTSFIV